MILRRRLYKSFAVLVFLAGTLFTANALWFAHAEVEPRPVTYSAPYLAPDDIRISFDIYYPTPKGMILVGHSVRTATKNGEWQEVITYLDPKTGTELGSILTVAKNGKGVFQVSHRQHQLEYLADRPSGALPPTYNPAASHEMVLGVEVIAGENTNRVNISSGVDVWRAVDLNGEILQEQTPSKLKRATLIEHGKFEIEDIPPGYAVSTKSFHNKIAALEAVNLRLATKLKAAKAGGPNANY